MTRTSDEVRADFLDFFKKKGHDIIPSSSLVPIGDPTLLLTTAGMVQFKPYYLGEKIPPNRRLASCQKCFRTTDIESVGDTKHLTFFEMLGNFSIGDYFKKEAITWGWEFVTRHMKLSPQDLWVTIFLDDDESYNYWREIGVSEKRIVRYGEKENFWGPAGNSGPCGPCSEIHYDFGEKVGCGEKDCAPNCSCGRFVEVWNLVFTQYNQDETGKRTPLPRPNIDTGMGLERATAVVNGLTSVYQTDLFVPLLQRVAGLAGKKYGADEDTDNAMRIVAEHSRGITFLIADGVIPSNEGRGYVLRRLLRRADLFCRRLGVDKPFLTEIARATIERMGHVYPELAQRQEFIIKVIELEEERFRATLNVGLDVIKGLIEYREIHKDAIPELVSFLRDFKPAPDNASRILEQHGFVGSEWKTDYQIGVGIASELISQVTHDYLAEKEPSVAKELLARIESWGQNISGQEAFRLYDTYGFPVELTREIVAKSGFSVDMDGFAKEMEKQRERARAAHKFESREAVKLNGLDVSETAFIGYESLAEKSKIVKVLRGSEPADEVKEGEEASLILDKTPFYGEMGGQIGDTGEIRSPSGRFLVTNTTRQDDVIVHQGYVVQGSLHGGEEVQAEVNKERRLDIARNHTATHLLQSALREVLGEHVEQRGSLVAPERLRFDFSHLTALTREEIQKVQQLVNDKIRQDLPVYSEETTYKRAIAEGAMALFSEKYGDAVRVMKIGRPSVSAELCGGTHVTTTGELGYVHIVSESSIGSGLRRIEAVTGRQAEAYVNQSLSRLEKLGQSLGASPENIEAKLSDILAELDKERKRTQSLERELARKEAESLLAKVESVKGINLLVARVSAVNQAVLRDMADFAREKMQSGIIVLATVYEDRPAFLVVVTPDVVAKGYNAGNIVKQVAQVAGGGGGGKPTLAQAGGKFKDKLDEALRLAKTLV